MIKSPSLEQLLGGISASEFINEYWQKKPCLIRQAWPLDSSPISGDELAGLACELENAARIVQEQHSDGPWKLTTGPFDDKDFAALPDSHWTLLVSDCEKHVPELQAFVEPFRFIPDWRIDDLMISYAADGGSVGPHVDEYDVFLLQLEGKREWRVGGLANPEDCMPGLQLQILKQFTPKEIHMLEPGDMLYLPPRVSHYGIGRGENCMTASIGFRAPEPEDLIHAWVDHVGDSLEDKAPLKDIDPQPQTHPGEIRADNIAALQQAILSRINPDNADFQRWLGDYLTEPKHAEAANYEHQPDQQEIDDAVSLIEQSKSTFVKNPYSNLAYMQMEKEILLFADGQHWALPNVCLDDIRLLTGKNEFRISQFTSLKRDAFYHCLTALMLAEVVYPDDE